MEKVHNACTESFSLGNIIMPVIGGKSVVAVVQHHAYLLFLKNETTISRGNDKRKEWLNGRWLTQLKSTGSGWGKASIIDSLAGDLSW